MKGLKKVEDFVCLGQLSFQTKLHTLVNKYTHLKTNNILKNYFFVTGTTKLAG